MIELIVDVPATATRETLGPKLPPSSLRCAEEYAFSPFDMDARALPASATSLTNTEPSCDLPERHIFMGLIRESVSLIGYGLPAKLPEPVLVLE